MEILSLDFSKLLPYYHVLNKEQATNTGEKPLKFV